MICDVIPTTHLNFSGCFLVLDFSKGRALRKYGCCWQTTHYVYDLDYRSVHFYEVLAGMLRDNTSSSTPHSWMWNYLRSDIGSHWHKIAPSLPTRPNSDMWGEDRVRVSNVVCALFSFSSMSLRHPLWGRVWVCKLNPTLTSFGG